MKQENELRELASCIQSTLDEIYPERMGFALIVFHFHRPGISDYISNAERENMIDALRETADRLESRQDIPKTIGES